MNINLNINATELSEAIQALAKALSITKQNTTSDQPTKPKPTQKSEPVEPVSVPKEEQNPDDPAITLEQVRAKLAALSQAGKQAQVKGLITKFGAVKLTDIPEAKYPELLAAAKKIEQEIATDKVKQKMEGTA